MVVGNKTICIGDRASFLQRLQSVLDGEHAVQVERSRHVVGRHMVITWEVHLDDGTIVLEDDTYLGKSITGPHQIVDRIASAAFGMQIN